MAILNANASRRHRRTDRFHRTVTTAGSEKSLKCRSTVWASLLVLFVVVAYSLRRPDRADRYGDRPRPRPAAVQRDIPLWRPARHEINFCSTNWSIAFDAIHSRAVNAAGRRRRGQGAAGSTDGRYGNSYETRQSNDDDRLASTADTWTEIHSASVWRPADSRLRAYHWINWTTGTRYSANSRRPPCDFNL